MLPPLPPRLVPWVTDPGCPAEASASFDPPPPERLSTGTAGVLALRPRGAASAAPSASSSVPPWPAEPPMARIRTCW